MNDSVSTPPPRTRVLQIVGNAIVGGMENYVTRLVEQLPRERFATTVLAPFESPFTDRLRGFGAEVCLTAINEEPSWQSIQLACALIRSHGIDVIQSHLPNAHVLAAIAGPMTGRPVLATIHGRAVTLLDIEVQRAAGTHLGVVCRHSQLHALGVGIDPQHIHFVPNGVDTERFRPLPERSGHLRTRFRIAAAAPVVGFVGRLSHEKGPEVFLAMALSVRAVHADAHFVLVGDGPMLKSLETSVARLGLAGAVHFAGVQDDMPAVFNEFDVAVSSSHSEAMPFAVMEAMASGLPVVASLVGGVGDLVQHGVSGWIANQNDHEGLATRVVDLLGDAELRGRVGRAARARARDRFALAQSLDATAQLLTRLSEHAEPRRVGTLHEATRPSRAGQGAAKSVQR